MSATKSDQAQDEEVAYRGEAIDALEAPDPSFRGLLKQNPWRFAGRGCVLEDLETRRLMIPEQISTQPAFLSAA